MSGTRVGAISANLELETQAWSGALTRSRNQLHYARRKIEADFSGINTAAGRLRSGFRGIADSATMLRGMLGPLALGLGVGALVSFTRRSIDSAGAISNMAAQAGVGAEALQVLRIAAERTGASAGDMDRALQTLTRTIGNAAGGNASAQAAFDRLGIAIRDADGSIRTTEAVLGDLADRLAAIQNPAERAAAAASLLGTAVGARLVQSLSQGRQGLIDVETQARQMGRVLSDETVTAANEAATAFQDMLRTAGDLARGLLAQLAPALSTIARGFRSLVYGVGPAEQSLAMGQRSIAIDRRLAEIDRELRAAPTSNPILERLDRLRGMQEQGSRGALASERAGLISEQNALIERSRELAREFEAAQEGSVLRGDGTPPVPTVPAAPPATTPARGGGARAEPASQLEAYMVRLRESVALAQLEAQVVNASAGERAAALAVFQAEARARTDAEAGIRGSVSLTQDERVAIEEAARARQTAADTEDRLNRLRSEGESVTRRYRTAQQAMNAEIKTLTDLFKEGAINAETFERAVTELQNNLNGLAEAARSIDQVFASAFEDAISGGKSFMDVLKALERDLLRIGTRLAMQTISSAIFGGGGKGGGGGIGGFIMSALGSVFGGGRAAGGPVDPSRWYVVGERGPEIFRPSTAGRIEPNQGGATRGGGGRPVNVFFQGVRDMNSFRDSQSAMAAFTTRAVMRGQRGL